MIRLFKSVKLYMIYSLKYTSTANKINRIGEYSRFDVRGDPEKS